MIPLERYGRLFRLEGIGQLLLTSVVGRIPIGIAGLAILLFVQGRTGSFAEAGAASASYVLGLGVVSPAVGRLLDRVGPRPILATCSVLYPVALALLMTLAVMRAHAAWTAIAAFVAGASLPPVTICVRALLPRVVRDPGLLQTAYSLDSALIETMFVMGPALVAVFVAAGYPGGAVLLAAVCAALGGPVFLRSDVLRAWRAGAAHARPGVFALLRGPLAAVYAATFFYSIAFGLYEVGVTAHATAAGHPAIAGIALALASAGSAVGAIVYGSRHWSMPLPRQFLAALMFMSAGILVVAPADNLYLFCVLNVAAGAPMATVISAQSLLVSRLAPPAAMAEAFTWGASCLLAGIGAGIATGGLLAESLSAAGIIAAASGATGIAAIIAWWLVPAPVMRREP